MPHGGNGLSRAQQDGSPDEPRRRIAPCLYGRNFPQWRRGTGHKGAVRHIWLHPEAKPEVRPTKQWTSCRLSVMLVEAQWNCRLSQDDAGSSKHFTKIG